MHGTLRARFLLVTTAYLPIRPVKDSGEGGQPAPARGDLPDWVQVKLLLRKNIPLLTLCTVLGAVAWLAHALMAVPRYSARAVLNVERDKIVPSEVGAGGNGNFFEQWNPEFLPTQLELLKSRDIAIAAARRLRLADEGPKGLSANGNELVGAALGIQGGLVAKIRPGTTLVDLSYQSSDPKRAAAVINAVADSYIEWVLLGKIQVVSQANDFLVAQIEKLRIEVEARERDLQAFSEKKSIVSLNPTGNATLLKLEALNKDYAQALTERVSKESRYGETMKAEPSTLADTGSQQLVAEREQVQKLESDYQRRLAVFKPEWPAMQQLSAEIVRAKEHLARATQEAAERVREAAKQDWLSAVRKEDRLKELLAVQRSEAIAQSSDSVEYSNLKVELETKRSLLDTLLKKQSETEVRSRLTGVRQGNVRVVEQALVPTSPIWPSYRTSLRNGIVAGFFLGLGLAWLRMRMDRSLTTAEEVQHALNLPTLGVIPALAGGKGGYGYSGYGYSRRKKKIAALPPLQPVASQPRPQVEFHAHEHPRSTGAECYRALRTALLLSRAGGVKSIVVTSGMPGEGKTCTAVNLSTVLGQLGLNVLLVDSDLHRPRLHQILGISNARGLASVLAKPETLAASLQTTKLPGVTVLPAGPGAPNPSGLLASDGMRRLLRSLEDSYDLVILDSPPVLLVADALVLGSLANGVVVTVHGGETTVDQLAKVRDRLQLNRINILGVVINNLREEALRYGNRGYYAAGDAYAPAYGERREAAES